MGGLITVRSMMKGETRIRKLVTMGTPYRGTHVIYLGYAVSILLVLALGFYLSPLAGSIYLALFLQIPSLWQMQPSSTFLQEVLAYLAKVRIDRRPTDHLPALSCLSCVRGCVRVLYYDDM